MKISIVISTYNRERFIGITLDSFLNLNFPKKEYEIIVVDNNSTDNTRDIVLQYGNKIKYVFEPRQGVHFAKNTGAKVAIGEILYFTDDDMIADSELLNAVLDVYNFDERVSTVTGKVLPKWEVPPPRWVAEHLTNQYLSLMDLREEFMITTSLDLLYTCHYAIKRKVFFQAEGFNPEMFGRKCFGDGETGLTIKTAKLGYLFGYNAKLIIHHIIPAARMTQKYLNKRIGVSGANAHAYTDYRANPSTLFLMKRTFLILPVKFMATFIKYTGKALIKKDFSHLRFALAWTIYYFNYAQFNIKLLTNPMFRKLTVKRDWLSNDDEFSVDEIMSVI